MVIETSLFPVNFDFIKLNIDSACILSACKLHGADDVTTVYLKFITGLLYLFTRSNNIIWKKTVVQQLSGEWSTCFSAKHGRRGRPRALHVRFLLTWKIRKNSACWRLTANFSPWKSFMRFLRLGCRGQQSDKVMIQSQSFFSVKQPSLLSLLQERIIM